MDFKEFFHQVDSKQIESVYNQAKIAVDLVNMYNPHLLNNISTIADLSSGAYGIYNSGENKKVLPPNIEQSLIYYGKINKNNIGNIPKKTIKQYYPDIPENAIQSSDTVRINIRRILRESKTALEAILQIASTIVHECTHEIEREMQGWTSESGPIAAERNFMAWCKQNIKAITTKFPVLNTQNHF